LIQVTNIYVYSVDIRFQLREARPADLHLNYIVSAHIDWH